MKKLITIVFVAIWCTAIYSQKADTLVLKHFDSGAPHVVVYFKVENGLHQKVKEITYYENGNIDYLGEVQDGNEHGKWEHYYEDGTLLSEGNYAFGLEHGKFKSYYPDGQLAESSIYEMGERKKHRTYRKRKDL